MVPSVDVASALPRNRRIGPSTGIEGGAWQHTMKYVIAEMLHYGFSLRSTSFLPAVASTHY
eukprot:5211628-Lingulodinium_polyedra.AAC.1